jgi:hypothetical protein
MISNGEDSCPLEMTRKGAQENERVVLDQFVLVVTLLLCCWGDELHTRDESGFGCLKVVQVAERIY